MFGLCQDRFTKAIYRLGYCLVPLPDASIKPLEVLGRQRDDLFRYGDLGDVFVPGNHPFPEIEEGITVGLPETSETMMLDNRIGLHVLSQWLGEDKAGLSGKLRRTAKFKMKLAGVTKAMVSPSLLDGFLVSASLKEDFPSIDRLMESDSLYITTAVLKASSLELETESGTIVDSDIEIPDVGQGVSGTAKVGVDGSGSRRVSFETKDPVVFAFQAARTLYHEGRYVVLHPTREKLHIMGGPGSSIARSAPPEETGYLADEIGVGFARFG